MYTTIHIDKGARVHNVVALATNYIVELVFPGGPVQCFESPLVLPSTNQIGGI